MKRDRTELEVERLLRACAIFPMLKGFYLLRDLILLCCRGKNPRDCLREEDLKRRYGKEERAAMQRALRRSWNRPECRLTEFMGRGDLNAPPSITEFVSALCRQIKGTNDGLGDSAR